MHTCTVYIYLTATTATTGSRRACTYIYQLLRREHIPNSYCDVCIYLTATATTTGSRRACTYIHQLRRREHIPNSYCDVCIYLTATATTTGSRRASDGWPRSLCYESSSFLILNPKPKSWILNPKPQCLLSRSSCLDGIPFFRSPYSCLPSSTASSCYGVDLVSRID